MTTQTPERILEAAVGEFAIHGYGAARLADIAVRAGIRRSSLLYHFESKERLYAAVVRRVFLGMAAALREGRGREGMFEARLRDMVLAFVRHLDAEPAGARVIVHELLSVDGPGRAVFLEEVVPLLDEVERWIASHAGGALRSGLPIRAALLEVSSDALLRAASGGLRGPLWGSSGAEHTWQLARLAFLAEDRLGPTWPDTVGHRGDP